MLMSQVLDLTKFMASVRRVRETY